MKHVIVPVTPLQQNCTLLWNSENGRGAVVDPGGDVGQILAAIKANGVTVEQILLTHGHFDHAGGAAELAERLGVMITGPHEADRFLLDGMARQAQMFGLGDAGPVSPDRWLVDGDQVNVGGETLAVLHLPGHTPGHVAFFHAPSRFALVGDVLFRGSIGRTDLPGGDYETLIRSILDRLLPLGDDIAFIPGHGPGSTLGLERRTNPFLAA